MTTLSTRVQLLVAGLLLVGTAPGRAQAVRISSVAPAANALTVARTSPIMVGFDQNILSTSVSGLQVFSSQRGGRRTQATPAAASGRSLGFAPVNVPYQPGEVVSYSITTAVASAGGPLAAGRVGQFTAAAGGTGRGIFVPPATGADLPVDALPAGLVVGDVDGDGDLDLVASCQGVFGSPNGTLHVRLNDGSGHFTAPATGANQPLPASPLSLSLNDLDGDGDLDVAVSSNGTGGVSIRLNNGTGLFTAPATGAEVPTNGGPAGLAVGDVDGDGDLDLLTANVSARTLSVRLNNGQAQFSAPAVTGEVLLNFLPYNIKLGDIDNDGDLDLLAGTYNGGVALLLNDGSGGFSMPSYGMIAAGGSAFLDLAVADIDNDGDLDFAVSNLDVGYVHFWQNDGTGHFSASVAQPPLLVGAGVWTLALADIDGDGDLDLSTANQYLSAVVTHFNNGTGTFVAPVATGRTAIVGGPFALVLADIDGDSDLDQLSGNSMGSNTAGAVSVRFNQATALAQQPAAPALAWQLLPNPAAGQTVLRGAAALAPVQVLDGLGRTVLSTITAADGTATLVLAPGLYVVRSGGRSQRLVVE